ncbi:High-affinity branched-chain amino acid transport system permease protein LivH [Sulfitobacter sp. THAF37]|uniref:branched-chain amino acid ABC transporter permease n=1 Tax=Sulfitobacter sp. THAF37 TaxID=2587855 RepID=UPI0012684138|nr:branched-chain amino acid ABC transporter permease [Sulfitobacter sp. THAF37]QFT57943.1 High-affinity branched-chain amino acid transport system permease protein LivH [Sulfitobacter sp. THAF37]
MTTAQFASLLFQGLTLGGLYAMIGAGLALNYGILKVLQLAHGEYITYGAFAAVGAIVVFPDLPFHVILLIAFLACALLGAAAQWLIVERAMAHRNEVVAMLVTFGLAVVLRDSLVETVGADLRGLSVGQLGQANFTIAGLTFGVLPLISLLIAIASFGLLTLLIFKTHLGRQIRAVSDLPDIAELVGAPVQRIHVIVAALSAGLAAIAGVLLAMRASVSPYSGLDNLLIAFEVVVLGGLGSIRGVLWAGFLLGMTQVVSTWFDGNAGLFYVHLVFFIVLVFRAMTGRLS